MDSNKNITAPKYNASRSKRSFKNKEKRFKPIAEPVPVSVSPRETIRDEFLPPLPDPTSFNPEDPKSERTNRVGVSRRFTNQYIKGHVKRNFTLSTSSSIPDTTIDAFETLDIDDVPIDAPTRLPRHQHHFIEPVSFPVPAPLSIISPPCEDMDCDYELTDEPCGSVTSYRGEAPLVLPDTWEDLYSTARDTSGQTPQCTIVGTRAESLLDLFVKAHGKDPSPPEDPPSEVCGCPIVANDDTLQPMCAVDEQFDPSTYPTPFADLASSLESSSSSGSSVPPPSFATLLDPLSRAVLSDEDWCRGLQINFPKFRVIIESSPIFLIRQICSRSITFAFCSLNALLAITTFGLLTVYHSLRLMIMTVLAYYLAISDVLYSPLESRARIIALTATDSFLFALILFLTILASSARLIGFIASASFSLRSMALISRLGLIMIVALLSLFMAIMARYLFMLLGKPIGMYQEDLTRSYFAP